MDYQSFQSRIHPARHKLYRFAFRFMGNREEAQDIVQETMARVWNQRESMDRVENWEAWCMRIVRNLSLDKLRSQGRWRVEGLADVPEIRHPATTQWIEQEESMRQIEAIMKQMPDRQRQVMQLRDIEGYAYNEIAEILEMELSHVKVTLFRARTFVRERLLKMENYGIENKGTA